MTNADKIRNMTDTELSKFLCDGMEKVISNTDLSFVCDYCPVKHLCEPRKFGEKNFVNGFEKWLKGGADNA